MISKLYLKKNRTGFTMIELLIAIVLLGILTSLAIGSGANAQRKARVTSAFTVVGDYHAAFSIACMNHPGLIQDRYNAYPKKEGDPTYSAKTAMKQLVGYMNESLEERLRLSWDSTLKCYKSRGEDPWGGNYILTEYPCVEGDTTSFNPTIGDKTMKCAIFVTGDDASILKGNVSEKSLGAGLEFKDSIVVVKYQGFEDNFTFTGQKLTLG